MCVISVYIQYEYNVVDVYNILDVMKLLIQYNQYIYLPSFVSHPGI
jgi:hypothetical protein